MICNRCNNYFENDWRKEKYGTPRFCSKNCAKSRSPETRNKISKSITNISRNKIPLDNDKYKLICINCNCVFYRKPSSWKRKTCSDICKNKILSEIKSKWLSDSKNRKNYSRSKRSYMEEYFIKFLNKHSIRNWKSEVRFKNIHNGKNYFVDFLFENLKLIIELDGTQHRNTIKEDKIRDNYLQSIGYKVIRIPYKEWQKGEWEETLLHILLYNI